MFQKFLLSKCLMQEFCVVYYCQFGPFNLKFFLTHLLVKIKFLNAFHTKTLNFIPPWEWTRCRNVFLRACHYFIFFFFFSLLHVFSIKLTGYRIQSCLTLNMWWHHFFSKSEIKFSVNKVKWFNPFLNSWTISRTSKQIVNSRHVGIYCNVFSMLNP